MWEEFEERGVDLLEHLENTLEINIMDIMIE
jgi:hypothetical protein